MFLKYLKLNIVLSVILFINICYTKTVEEVKENLQKYGFSITTFSINYSHMSVPT
eukprot:jgi/Orpsp1_1/1184783/evm.model.c7180000090973.1